MKRVNLLDMYDTPDFYDPPADDQLATNTQYPNLNSLEYKLRPPAERSRSRKFFERLAINEAGNAVLVGNRYTDRVWHGHIWGFERLADVNGDVEDCIHAGGDSAALNPAKEAEVVPVKDGAVYRLRCKATLTQAEYVEDNMLLLADTEGTLALWSTRAQARAADGGYCLFRIGQQSEHCDAITALDASRTNPSTARTAAADGCLKCWDMGNGDLYSTQTFRAAHSRSITGMASIGSGDVFATVSLDKRLQLWDIRQARPIVGVLQAPGGHNSVGLTAVVWSEATARLLVGDEAGDVHSVDVRSTGDGQNVVESGCPRFARTWRPASLSTADDDGGRVHRLRLDATQRLVAVVADSTVVNVLDTTKDDASAVVFSTAAALDYVRDVHWADGLYTIGWGAALQKHDLNAVAAAIDV